jgi:hypothetical protein
MLLRFFRTNGAQILIFIPFIGILLWLGPVLIGPKSYYLSHEVHMPVYEFLEIYINKFSFLPQLIALILVLSIGFLMVRINTRFILINNRTYLPAIIFVLLTSGIPEAQNLNPAIIACFAILFMIEKVLDSYRYEGLFYEFFTAAFVLGVGALIYPLLIFYQIVLWIGIAYLRQFNWREWAFTILGLITPYIFAFSYCYIILDDAGIIINNFNQFYNSHQYYSSLPLFVLGFVIIVTLIIAISSQAIIKMFPTRKIVSRRAFSMFFWLFLLTVALYIVFNRASLELTYIAAIPVAFLLSNYLVFVKSGFWGNTLLWIFIGSIIFTQISYYYLP